jgi:hypothetical protein
MRTHARRTDVRPTGVSAAMPMISIGAADIATGCTDESRYWDSEQSEIVRVGTRLEKRAHLTIA